MPREESVQDEDNMRVWKKRPSVARYPNAKYIFALFPSYTPVWKLNPQFCISAENLFIVHGVEDCQQALSFALKHRKEPFCPKIFTPYDLDMKWDKLVEYSLKK